MPSKATICFLVFVGAIFLLNCPRLKAIPAQAANQGANLLEHDPASNVDHAFHAALQASVQALQDNRFEAAETSAKSAVALAEKMRPQDSRLPEAIGQLGAVYASNLDYKQAEESFQEQLKAAERLYGSEHPLVSSALENLAMTALAQRDFATSEAYFSRALQLNELAHGENSTAVSENLRCLAHIYSEQKDYAKSEATLLRVVKIYEAIYGPGDRRVAIPLKSLCSTYDNWGEPEKSAPCHARLVSLAERQFGPSSYYLVRDLSAEAQALRQLGRATEAAAVEQRVQTIQSALSGLN